MRLLLFLAAASLLLSCSSRLHAQEDLINCQTFTSDFSTPDGCIDGAQPSSGPIPPQPEVVEDADPFGWGYGPEDGFDPGFGFGW